MEKDELLKALCLPENTKIALEVVDSIPSTNDFFKTTSDWGLDSDLQIVIAETQTQGRGRFGNTWFSPAGENLYLSCQRRFNTPPHQRSSLSLIIALALVQALEPFIKPVDLKIKWPNDILYQSFKLSGILIESRPQDQVVIGIGLNINMLGDEHGVISQHWTSLKKITAKHFNREQIAAALISRLAHILPEFEQKGFSAFKEQWAAYDYLLNQEINIKVGLSDSQIVNGIARGLDDEGYLLLELKDGQLQAFASGDTSRVNLVYY